ncbi:unnamed protein product [Chrysoparadoxa australica]
MAGRPGGRDALELRRVFIDFGGVTQSAGSAYMEMDHTKVVCAVYGPHASRRMDTAFSEEGQLRCDVRFAPFASKEFGAGNGFSDAQSLKEKELSAMLKETLEGSIHLQVLTKSVVDVYVVILQVDGGELGAAVTCASLALADAGIELVDLVTACSVSVQKQSQNTCLLLDPTLAEEQSESGNIMVAVMPSSQEVMQWRQTGRMGGKDTVTALELCLDGCASVHAMMRAALLRRAKLPPVTGAVTYAAASK